MRNFPTSKYKFRAISNVTEKLIWLNKFSNEYKWPKRAISNCMLGDDVKYFKCVSKKRAIGFIRITDKSNHFGSVALEHVWAVEDAYVEDGFRRTGAYRAMLNYVVTDHAVRLVHLHKDIHAAHRAFYDELGFGAPLESGDGAMVWLAHDLVMLEARADRS